MRFFLALVASLFFCLTLNAQIIEQEESAAEEVEHLGIEAQIDSLVLGKSIFEVLPGSISIFCSPEVRSAFNSQLLANEAKQFSGFRIRLYLDSRRNAREESASIIRRFNSTHPHVQAYRSYSAPNFKVTVGNFRTRVEAEALLRDLKSDFPNAFIVREKFKYPSIGDPEDTPLDLVSLPSYD